MIRTPAAEAVVIAKRVIWTPSTEKIVISLLAQPMIWAPIRRSAAGSQAARKGHDGETSDRNDRHERARTKVWRSRAPRETAPQRQRRQQMGA
jgi:hypothetical protein